MQTDGFSDNVFPSEMVTICSLVARAGGTEDKQVQNMADRMVEYARQCMKSRTRVSPFERGFLSFILFFFSLFVAPNTVLRSTRQSLIWLRSVQLTSNPCVLGQAAREGMYFRGGVSFSSTSSLFANL